MSLPSTLCLWQTARSYWPWANKPNYSHWKTSSQKRELHDVLPCISPKRLQLHIVHVAPLSPPSSVGYVHAEENTVRKTAHGYINKACTWCRTSSNVHVQVYRTPWKILTARLVTNLSLCATSSLFSPLTSVCLLGLLFRMIATLSKIGEGAFADVYGCQGDDWRKLALKVTLFD